MGHNKASGHAGNLRIVAVVQRRTAIGQKNKKPRRNLTLAGADGGLKTHAVKGMTRG
jgi:hypothetical protein